jgi:competence protein ComEA
MRAKIFGVFMLCMAASLSGGAAKAQQNAQGASQQQDAHPSLPPGAGRDTLVKVCSQCHAPENVIANRQDRQGWENTLTKMSDYGAVASDDQFSAILEYLVKNFSLAPGGPVNVNKATSAELQSGLKLTDKQADAVVAYREKNGDFKSLDDLKKVPELDPKQLDAEKSGIVF